MSLFGPTGHTQVQWLRRLVSFSPVYLGVALRMLARGTLLSFCLGKSLCKRTFLEPVGNIDEQLFLYCLQGVPVMDTRVKFSVLLPWK